MISYWGKGILMPILIITIIRLLSVMLSFAIAAHLSDGSWLVFDDNSVLQQQDRTYQTLLAGIFMTLGVLILVTRPSPVFAIIACVMAVAISHEALFAGQELSGLQYRAILLVVLCAVLLLVTKPNFD